MKFLQGLFFLFLITGIIYPDIQMQRYSISTYTNSNYIESDIGMLGTRDSEAGINSLTAIRVLFRQYANPNAYSSSTLSVVNRLTLVDSLESDIYEAPLIYPNPFKLSETAILGYWLSQPDNIEIQVYDLFGHKIFEEVKVQGMLGARMGYNRIEINSATFNYYNISAGTYFLFIFDSDRNLIGKSKFAVVP